MFTDIAMSIITGVLTGAFIVGMFWQKFKSLDEKTKEISDDFESFKDHDNRIKVCEHRLAEHDKITQSLQRGEMEVKIALKGIETELKNITQRQIETIEYINKST